MERRTPRSRALVFASILALCCCALAVPIGGEILEPAKERVRMKCAYWAWQTCIDMGNGIHALSLNPLMSGAMHAPAHFVGGRVSMRIRLPQGNTEGVVFAYYLMDTITPTNRVLNHSEIDFEFYGNKSAGEILMALNVYGQGHQNLAQFTLPWDPSEDFHTYTIEFGSRHVAWYIDGKLIRVVHRTLGKPWFKFAMQPQASVWHPNFATKPTFENGAIGALFSDFKAEGCILDREAAIGAPSSCPGPWNDPPPRFELESERALYNRHKLTDFGWDKVLEEGA